MEIKSSYYKVEVGPMTNVAVHVAPGFALYLTAAELDAQRYRTGASINAAFYNEYRQCISLEDPYATLKLDLRMTDVTQNAGHWKESNPQACYGVIWLELTDQEGHLTSVASCVGNPDVQVEEIRYTNLDTLGAAWSSSLTLGAAGSDVGITLSWGTDIHGKFVAPICVTPNGMAHKLPLTFQQLQEYALLDRIWFRVCVEYDRIIIASNMYGTPWCLYNPVAGQPWNIPAAPWEYDATGVNRTVWIKPIKATTSASIVTGWIDCKADYDDADLQWRVFPTPDSHLVGMTVTSASEAGSHRKQFTISLTGDGQGIPYIQAIGVQFPPTWTEPTDTWVDVSRYVTKLVDKHTYDMAPGEDTLTINLLKQVDGMNFYDYLNANLPDPFYGELMVRTQIGLTATDDTTVGQTRLTGVWEAKTPTHGIIQSEITGSIVRDWWCKLAKQEMLYAPCVTDLGVAAALTLWLKWGGVDPSRIEVDINLTEDLKVCEPHHGYASPQWRPAYAAKAGELIRQLCQAKGYRVYFDGDGVAHITWRANEALDNVGVYGYDTGNQLTHAANVESIEDFGNAVNRVLVTGKALEETPDSPYNPPYYEIWQPDAKVAGSMSYTGNYQSQAVVNDNLRTNDECAIMGWNIFGGRDTGLPKYRLRSAYGGWNRWPGEYILVQDPVAIGINPDGTLPQYLCRVRETETTVSRVMLETTMLAENLSEIDAGY